MLLLLLRLLVGLTPCVVVILPAVLLRLVALVSFLFASVGTRRLLLEILLIILLLRVVIVVSVILLLLLVTVIVIVVLWHAISRLVHFVRPLPASSTGLWLGVLRKRLLIIIETNGLKCAWVLENLPLVSIPRYLIFGLNTLTHHDMAQIVSELERNFLTIKALVNGLILVHGVSRQIG